MNRVAKFEKISFEQFYKDWMETYPEWDWSVEVGINTKESIKEEIRRIYNKIQLPQRSTSGSAGYDFFTPVHILIPYMERMIIPTGLRCKIEEGWFLDINPRSGHGFKYGIQLANTRGIIDSDYYNSDNEGHIMIQLVNQSPVLRNDFYCVEEGKAYAQGIFTIYGITEDDNVNTKRNGGMGSTDRREKNEN